MKCFVLRLGMVSTNCYLLANEETHEAIIVDPADQAGSIAAKIQKEELKPVAVFLTHGHFDHILACEELKRMYHIPVYAYEKEKEVLSDPNMNLTGNFGMTGISMQADVWLTDRQLLTIAGLSCKVIATPGHTPGSCCYYFEDEKTLISGDTLFCGSVGRTDFPGGSASLLLESGKKLLTLPEDVKVLPGHEQATTIGHEKKYNYYLGEGDHSWFD